MSAENVHVGRLVAERYRLDEMLGRGGYGSVYKGWDTQVGRDVAVKLLEFGSGERTAAQIHELRERFRREAQSAQQINHRSIVKVYDFGIPEGGGETYLVMELLTGRDLGDELALNGPLAPERVQRLFVPLLEGLGRGHELGIVHKDIKPQNIFFCDPDTPGEALCLVDFGVARVMHEHKLTVTGLIVGTPQYLAPEYVTDALVTPALDVYQMGLILVELITGKPAIPPGETFVKSCNRHFIGDLDIPSELFDGEFGEVLRQALAANPSQRMQSASEFAGRLAQIDPSTIAIPFRKTMVFMRGDTRPTATAPIEFAPMSQAQVTAELERESGALLPPGPATPVPSTAQMPGNAPIRYAQPLLAPVLPPAAEPPAPASNPPSTWMTLVALVLVLGLLGGGVVLAVLTPASPNQAPGIDTVVAPPTKKPLEIKLEAAPTTVIASDPPGAKILVNGVEVGVTPGTVELGRAATVELRLDGFEPATAQVVEHAPVVKLIKSPEPAPAKQAPAKQAAAPAETPTAPTSRSAPPTTFEGRVFEVSEEDEAPADAGAAPADAPAKPEKFERADPRRWDKN